MAKALKVIRRTWKWIERVAARHAAHSNRRPAAYLKMRRREVLRRMAARMGSY